MKKPASTSESPAEVFENPNCKLFEDLRRNVGRPVRCPKCREYELILTEQAVQVTLRFQQGSDRRLKRQKIDQRMLDSKVEGRCVKCGHQWTVRGITHLSDLTYAFPNKTTGGKTRQRTRRGNAEGMPVSPASAVN